MAKITKKWSLIQAIAGVIILIIGLLCALVFSKQSYSKSQHFIYGGVIYDNSGQMVKKVTAEIETVSTTGSYIVVENKYLKTGGIVFACIGGLQIVMGNFYYAIARSRENENRKQ